MIIKMEKVCKSFGHLQVLKDIDFEVEQGLLMPADLAATSLEASPMPTGLQFSVGASVIHGRLLSA